MEEIITCPFCKKNNWIVSEFPAIRKCNTPNCKGLHPYDIGKLKDIPGIIYDKDNLLKGMK